MKQLFTISILIIACCNAVWLNGCAKNNSGTTNEVMPFDVPAGFPSPVNNFTTNPVTKAGFELGRKLFYDGLLSKDGNFACASCHQQFAAFATYDHDFSHGFNNQFTTRNTPGLFNLAWQTNFHWDGGINHLELQPLGPITAPNEMAEDISNVINKLKNTAAYPPMFEAAFGSNEINSQKMLKALSQFMLMMVSANSKYDKVKRGEATFTQYEAEGYKVFQSKCNTCHKEPLFTDNSYRNNGLTLNATLKDVGRMRITGDRKDSLKFKVPSLRNVALTFPYMHDGRLYSLTQVIEHYASGIVQSPTLDTQLSGGVTLTYNDKFYLQAFLKALTDSSFIADKKLTQPL